MDSKIKICFDASWYYKPKQGVDYYTERLIRGLNEYYSNEFEIHLLTNKNSEAEFTDPNYVKHFIHGPVQARHLYLQPFIHKITNYLTPDIVHLPFYNYPGKFRSKKLISVHDLYFMYHPEHLQNKRTAFYFQNIFMKLLDTCDGIVTISESTKRDIIKFVPSIDPCKIEVIYSFTDDNFNRKQNNDEIKILAEKYNLDRPYLLFVGDSAGRKNIKNLLLGFNDACVQGFNEDLVLIGNYNVDSVKADRNELQHKNRIHLIGYVNDENLITLHQNARYCIVPSLYEGFSYPTLQSIKCGIPVIVSDNSCLTEVGGNAALYINSPFDDMAIKEALLKSENENVYQTLKEQCNAQADLFNKEEIIKKFAKFYRNILK